LAEFIFVAAAAAAAVREPLMTTRTATFSGALDYVWLSRRHWQVEATLQVRTCPMSNTCLSACQGVMTEAWPDDPG